MANNIITISTLNEGSLETSDEVRAISDVLRGTSIAPAEGASLVEEYFEEFQQIAKDPERHADALGVSPLRYFAMRALAITREPIPAKLRLVKAGAGVSVRITESQRPISISDKSEDIVVYKGNEEWELPGNFTQPTDAGNDPADVLYEGTPYDTPSDPLENAAFFRIELPNRFSEWGLFQPDADRNRGQLIPTELQAPLIYQTLNKMFPQHTIEVSFDKKRDNISEFRMLVNDRVVALFIPAQIAPFSYMELGICSFETAEDLETFFLDIRNAAQELLDSSEEAQEALLSSAIGQAEFEKQKDGPLRKALYNSIAEAKAKEDAIAIEIASIEQKQRPLTARISKLEEQIRLLLEEQKQRAMTVQTIARNLLREDSDAAKIRELKANLTEAEETAKAAYDATQAAQQEKIEVQTQFSELDQQSADLQGELSALQMFQSDLQEEVAGFDTTISFDEEGGYLQPYTWKV